jgi:hypothetical protein
MSLGGAGLAVDMPGLESNQAQALLVQRRYSVLDQSRANHILLYGRYPQQLGA